MSEKIVNFFSLPKEKQYEILEKNWESSYIYEVFVDGFETFFPDFSKNEADMVIDILEMNKEEVDVIYGEYLAINRRII